MKNLLIGLRACDESLEWVKDLTIEEAVEKCNQADWMLWLAKRVQVHPKKTVLAASLCAKLGTKFLEDKCPSILLALDVFIKYGRGRVSRTTLDQAVFTAYNKYEYLRKWRSSQNDDPIILAAEAIFAVSNMIISPTAYIPYNVDVELAALSTYRAFYKDSLNSNGNLIIAGMIADKVNIEMSNICRDIIGRDIVSKVKKRLLKKKC